MGGAIYNAIGIIGDLSGRFIGNYAKTESASHPALGGAVYSANDLTISADGTETLFRGNYTEDSRGKINNAVWMQGTDEARLNLNLDARNGGKSFSTMKSTAAKPFQTKSNMMVMPTT